MMLKAVLWLVLFMVLPMAGAMGTAPTNVDVRHILVSFNVQRSATLPAIDKLIIEELFVGHNGLYSPHHWSYGYYCSHTCGRYNDDTWCF